MQILPPIIRPEVIAAKDQRLSAVPSLLVYITAQELGHRPLDRWLQTIASALPANFCAHVFLPKSMTLPQAADNIAFYHHGSDKFDKLLARCHGVVSTAGHTLLSESMYLEKPVYALPLPLYEQKLNAQVIAEGGFGMSRVDLTKEDLRLFLSNLDVYKKNIQQDATWLFKQPGNSLIIEQIENVLHG